jgi:hypothetical protein
MREVDFYLKSQANCQLVRNIDSGQYETLFTLMRKGNFFQLMRVSDKCAENQ